MKYLLSFVMACMLFIAACDKSVEERSATVAVTFKFVDEANQPVPGVVTDLYLIPDSTTVAYTDTSNQQGLTVFQLNPDSVYQSFSHGYSPVNCIYQLLNGQQIGPFTNDTTICIEVKGNVGPMQPTLFTAIGRLVDCNNQPVTSGFVRYWGVEYPVSSTGNFQIQRTQCAGNPPSDGFYCYDANNFKVTTTASTPWVAPIQDFGDIQVCDDPQNFVTINTSSGLSGVLYTGQCHAIDSFQIQFELLGAFAHTTPFRLGLSFTPNPATAMLGTYQTGYAQVTATNGQSGYWCSANCTPLTVIITKWEGLGGVAEGSFSGYLPQFGTGNPLVFDGNFSGRFRVPIYH
jgi:hypothetical protein